MKQKPFTESILTAYNFGALLLFLGLLWMFLPHAVHQLILSEEQETSHILHIVQGVIVAVGGLGFMLLGKKYNKY